MCRISENANQDTFSENNQVLDNAKKLKLENVKQNLPSGSENTTDCEDLKIVRLCKTSVLNGKDLQPGIDVVLKGWYLSQF